VAPWVTLRRPARHYLPAEQHGWSRFGRIVELRQEVLAAVDGSIDFAQFDNDGPDGIPNSGDDDGFVDFVAIVYALPCPGDTRPAPSGRTARPCRRSRRAASAPTASPSASPTT
jgi:hypothetical protein